LGTSISTETGEVNFWINGEHLGVAATGFGKKDFGMTELYFPKICTTQVTAKANLVGPFKYVGGK
jgi:hypothetical protein